MRTITLKEWIPIAKMQEWVKEKGIKENEAIRRRAVWMGIQHYESKTISLAVGRTRSVIFGWFKEWNIHGPKGVIPKPRGGRVNETLTLEQEKEVLASFSAEAAAGRLVSLGTIHKKVCEAAGDEKVSQVTTWNILKRNKWRKIVPRKHHAKRDLEAQEAFKEKGGFRRPGRPWHPPENT